MGADVPIPPVMMCAAAPDGAPPRRNQDRFHLRKFNKYFLCFNEGVTLAIAKKK